MTNYREILRLSSLQYSQRTIESMAHCSRHTVRDVLQAAKEQGISWPLSDDITNAELEQLLFPNKHKASSRRAVCHTGGCTASPFPHTQRTNLMRFPAFGENVPSVPGLLSLPCASSVAFPSPPSIIPLFLHVSSLSTGR